MKRKMWKRLATLALATVLTVGLVPGAQAAVDYDGADLTISGSATRTAEQYTVTYSATLEIAETESAIVSLVNAARVNENWLEALRFTCYLEDGLLKNALTESDLEDASLAITGTDNYVAVSTHPVKTANGVSATYKLTDAAVGELSASTLSAEQVAEILAEDMNITFTGTLANSEVWNAVGGASTISTIGYILVTYDETIAGENGFNADVSARVAEATCTTTISPTASSGSSSSSTTYAIEVVETSNGDVKLTPTRASKGTRVTITVTPRSGYELSTLSVVDKDGNKLELTDKGNGQYTFIMPGSNVTVTATFAPAQGSALPFTDVATGDWFYDAVAYVYENGLVDGTSATTFSPDVLTNRGMMATILWRMEDKPQVDYAMSFTDVATDIWYTEAVRWAASEEIMKGYSDTQFGPDDVITREQLATVFWRYLGSPAAESDLSAYPDGDSVGSWAVDAMTWAVDSGVINGTGDGTLKPQAAATRAELVTVLMRVLELQ